MNKLKLIFKALLASALVVFAGCSDISSPSSDNYSGEKSAKVTLSLGDVARTILPEVDLTSEYTFTVKTTASGSSNAVTHFTDKTYAEITASNAISLDAGTYTFTVTATNTAKGATLQGSTTKAISSGSNTVSIKLADATTGGTGTVDVTLTYTKNAGVAAIKSYWGEAVPSESAAVDVNLANPETAGTCTLSKTGVASGKTYYVAFYLYNSSNELLGSCYDTVYVVAGYNTVGEKNVKLKRLSGMFPANGETNAYADTYLEIIFDSTPTINRASSGTVRIYDSENNLIDTIKPAAETMYGYGYGGNAGLGSINVQYQLIQVIDNIVRIIPHHNTSTGMTLLENSKTYYVLIDNGIITGTMGGSSFAGITDSTTWKFTTGSAPTPSNNTLTVGEDKEFITVQGAFSYLMANSKTGDWTIKIDAGTYYERLFYSGSANITMSGQGSATYGTDVEIQWCNQDGKNADESPSTLWNTGARGRNVFYYAGKDLTLENLSIVNTATRKSNEYGEHDSTATSDNANGSNQAEALLFDSTGNCAAYNCNFTSKQDTVYLSPSGGKAWFYGCKISGDVDFIWGLSDVALFERCNIISAYDSDKTSNHTTYVVAPHLSNTNAPFGKGFVIYNSTITTESGQTTYLARSPWGTSGSVSQVAIIDTAVTGGLASNPWYGNHVGGSDETILGWKWYGVTSDGTAISASNKISQAQYEAEFAGRRNIINRVYNGTAFEKASSTWDVNALATARGWNVVADNSKEILSGETVKTSVVYDFTSLTGYTEQTSYVSTVSPQTGSGDNLSLSNNWKWHGSTYGLTASGSSPWTITVPVSGACTIAITNSYTQGSPTVTLPSSTMGKTTLTANTTETYTYTGTPAANLDFSLSVGSGTFYISKIVVTYTSTSEEESSSSVTGISLSASPTTTSSATGTSTLTATVTGDNSANVTWSIESGSDYAELSSSSTTASSGTATVTLTGKNATTSTQTVTVKATAGSYSKTVNVTIAAAESGETTIVLWKAEDYTTQTYTSNTTMGIMTVSAATGGTVEIDASSKSSSDNEYSFTKRLKLGGAGANSYRTMAFTTTGATTVTVYAMSSNTTDSRTLICASAINTSLSGQTVSNTLTNPAPFVFNFDTAGTYYIYSSSGGINIYGVKVVYASGSSTPTTGVTAVSITGNNPAVGGSVTLNANVTGTPQTASYLWTITDGTGYASFANTVGTTTITTSTNTVTLYGISAGDATVTVKVDDKTSSAKTITVVDTTASTKIIKMSDVPEGFAGIDSDNYFGKYTGWTTVTAHTRDEFEQYAESTTAYIIQVDTMIDLSNGMLPSTYDGTTDSLNSFISTTTNGSYTSYDDWRTNYAAQCKKTTDEEETGYKSDLVSTQTALTTAYKEIVQIDFKSNKMVIGVAEGAGVKGGSLMLSYVDNIAIRNMIIQDAYDPFPHHEKDSSGNSDGYNSQYDCVTVQGTCNYIWIDHCLIKDTLTDHVYVITDKTTDSNTSGWNTYEKWQTYDGLCDMKGDSHNITVSNCIFKSHDKTMLIGPDDKTETFSSGKGLRTITLVNNYFQDCVQRLPMVRNTKIHVVNNYYNFTKYDATKKTGSTSTTEQISSSYAIGVRYGSKVYSQANYFDSGIQYSYSGEKEAKNGYIKIVDDSDNSSKKQNTSKLGTDRVVTSFGSGDEEFEPSNITGYSVTLKSAEAAKTYVKANAGAGCTWSATE